MFYGRSPQNLYLNNQNMTKSSFQDFKISPKYKVSDWCSLNLKKENSRDWQKAIDIFDDRIQGRFLRQVVALESNKDNHVKEFSGFAIMAIDCLLIETLQQFYFGKECTAKGKHAEAFHNFFQRLNKLASFFDTIDKTKIFYSHIRCGILHQAQTKKNSILHIRVKSPILEWVNIRDSSEGISINRKKFHSAVIEVYENYVNELRSDSNLDLRRKFEKKMNIIANQT